MQRIDLSTMSQLVEYAILTCHEGIGCFAMGRRSAYWILDARWAMGRFAMGRRTAYWGLDARWANGRNEFSAPLIELASRDEIWETIGARCIIIIDTDVCSDEIGISKFAKLLNDRL